MKSPWITLRVERLMISTYEYETLYVYKATELIMKSCTKAKPYSVEFTV